MAQKYRVAWRALSIFDPDGSWSRRLKELKPKDISSPGRDPDDSMASNSHYELSWIWLVQHMMHLSPAQSEMHIREDEFNQSMCVKWAKARARKMRWKEELMLIQEEMRRVIVFHRWKADWWRDRASVQTHDDQVVLSGISGYAHKQADICVCLAEQCAHHWLPPLKASGISPLWGLDYEHLLPVSSDGKDETFHSTTLDIDGEDLDDEGDEIEGQEEHEVDKNIYFELDDI